MNNIKGSARERLRKEILEFEIGRIDFEVMDGREIGKVGKEKERKRDRNEK